jgi:serine/threonine protein kinase
MTDDALNLEEARSCLAEHGYELLQHIGSGHYARVYTVRDARYPDELFCVKIVTVPHDARNESIILTSYHQELDALTALSHPQIVMVYAHFSSPNYCYMVLEYCENGSMADYLKVNGRVPPTILPGYCHWILEATAYLHNSRLCHGDIKPANILLDKYHRPKLADFGFAKAFASKDRMICGSFVYQSPELVRHRVKDRAASDIWALGVTFYELAFGKLPWTGNCETVVALQISDCEFAFPQGSHPNFVALIRAMLNYMPEMRGSAEGLLQMPFFAGMKLVQTVSDSVVVPRATLTCAGHRAVGRRANAKRRALPPLPQPKV